MSSEGAPKILIIFDYDHTIISENSDAEVRKLHPQPYPERVQNILDEHNNRPYHLKDHTIFKREVFSLLHANGIKEDQIRKQILGIPLVDGMKELFEFLKHDKFEVIIVSDANTVFIDWSMRENEIHSQVARIYSNSGEFREDGMLTTHAYHQQNWCEISAANICKGDIVENHMKERKAAGVSYSSVVYVGDGRNDYCPTLKLTADDYVFPRQSFALEKVLQENSSQVKAKVVPWSSGTDIQDNLQKLMESLEKSEKIL